MKKEIILTEFARDCIKGLSAPNKYLSSKYFYDRKGSEIFQQIMRMPEYYLTDCELEIFHTQKEEIFSTIIEQIQNPDQFNLVELGAGDGLKTKILLDHFLNQKIPFEYVPIDISKSAIDQLLNELKNDFPELKTKALAGDYFHLLEDFNRIDKHPKIILFLGSNIGNFRHPKDIQFLSKLGEQMKENDLIFIGFDLKKDPQTIIQAYDDPHGYTNAFNLNLLERMNRELGANFDLTQFKHTETYEEESGSAKSYLISLKNQQVNLELFGQTFFFEEGEPIFMEISQKYDEQMIQDMARNSGFEIVRNFYDKRLFYTDSLWRKV